MLIDIDMEVLEKIAVKMIEDSIDDLSKESQKECNVPLFSYDKKQEKKLIKRLRKALLITKEYYSVTSEDKLEGLLLG